MRLKEWLPWPLRRKCVWLKYNFPEHIRRIWVATLPTQSVEHLRSIRLYEIDSVLPFFPSEPCEVLEIGGGTGWQAKELSERGFTVTSVDLANSCYAPLRIFPVEDYDGYTLPFSDNSFDVIYSSNVLEHIPHVVEFQREMHRVLRPEGICIHLLPSTTWRFWTCLTYYVRHGHRLQWLKRGGLRQKQHGERGGVLMEFWIFSKFAWLRLFKASDWLVFRSGSGRLFYTGNSVLDHHIAIKYRHIMSFFVGSACNYFVLRHRIHNSCEDR